MTVSLPSERAAASLSLAAWCKARAVKLVHAEIGQRWATASSVMLSVAESLFAS